MVIKPEEQSDVIPESGAARWAWRVSLIPLLGVPLFILLAFLALYRIGSRGRTGFYRLRNGLVAVFFLSILPIAGLVWWAELPQKYYVALNKITKHGCYTTFYPSGIIEKEEYFRFGKQVRLVEYGYGYDEWDDAVKVSEESFVDGKRNGSSFYWDMNGSLRLHEQFVNGKRHGLTSWFNKNGYLKRTMNYVEDISQEQIDAAKKAGVPVTIEEDLGGGVKMKMVFIPPGEFMMGVLDNEDGRSDDEGPQHKVTIKQAFYMCETEVTQAQWKAIMGTNPSLFKNGVSGTTRDTSNYPLESVSWDNVHEYLKKLKAKREGEFRLPSEAEWEYACRGGTTTPFYFGDDGADLYDNAWYKINSGGHTHTVGMQKPNYWGLFDMLGNVWEWCEDDWHDNYQKAPSDENAWIYNPRDDGRVFRGGAWNSNYNLCRSANRNGRIGPSYQTFDLGFRLAKSLSE